jgi:hypothetical protein
LKTDKQVGFKEEAGKSAIKNHQSTIASKNPSSSNKTRTADTSTCSGSREVSLSSLDNTALDLP